MISINYHQLQLIKVNNYFSLFLLLFLVWNMSFSLLLMRLTFWSFRPSFFFSGRCAWKRLSIIFFESVINKHNIIFFWFNTPVINAYKIACDFLPWQKLLQLLHQLPPYQLVLMVIFNATLKLAELIPRIFLLSSKNSVAFDIYLGKWQTVEPLLTMLFIVNFSNEFPGTKRQSSRSFRKCT